MLRESQVADISDAVREWKEVSLDRFQPVADPAEEADPSMRPSGSDVPQWSPTFRQCRARKVALPATLCAWVETGFARGHPEICEEADAREVLVAAAMAAYGHAGEAVAPGHIEKLVVETQSLGNSERIVESVLVDAFTDPAKSQKKGNWGARTCMIELVARVIENPLQWVARRCYGIDDNRILAVWMYDENNRDAIAALLTGWLEAGCRCCEHAEVFHLNSLSAEKRCGQEHHLKKWIFDREPLHYFLRRATFGHTKNVKPKGFVNGMLAKVLAFDDCFSVSPLRGGGTLRCACGDHQMAPQEGAESSRNGHGWIQEDNRCSACGELSVVTEQTYWLWPDGKFVKAAARRCRLCEGRKPSDGVLYRVSETDEPEPCPQGHAKWSQRITLENFAPGPSWVELSCEPGRADADDDEDDE